MKGSLMCPKCTIHVHESHTHCPVCGRFLHDVDSTTKQHIYPTPNYKHIEKKTSTTLQSVLAFPLLFALLVSILLDAFILQSNFGASFLVTLVVIYVWILIYRTILPKNGPGEKILWQMFGLTFFFLLLGFITEGSFNTWAIQYVIPILLGVGNVLFFIIVTVQRRTDVILLQMLIMSLFSMTPWALSFINLNDERVTSFIIFLLGLLNIIALLTYLRKKFFAYIQRWLHI
jgi:hypothetical protein